MPVFISHSFDTKSKAQYENVADALKNKGVPYWNPDEVKPGSSLRDQLREAVARCELCIFVATHSAVESNWCGAELGAFWGVDKPILVYLADSSLDEEQLPRIVQGDVWEQNLSRVAKEAARLLKLAEAAAAPVSEGSRQVGDLTVDQLQELIATQLAAASAKSAAAAATPGQIRRGARDAAARAVSFKQAARRSAGAAEDWRNQILWVDDRPADNINERHAFESMGLEFTLARSTDEALAIMAKRKFGAVISDMGRAEGPREGYVLLDSIRQSGDHTPYFIYAGSRAPQHRREARRRGAQGTTNLPHELVNMVSRALFEDSPS